jgi:hypothetical protein
MNGCPAAIYSTVQQMAEMLSQAGARGNGKYAKGCCCFGGGFTPQKLLKRLTGSD